MKMYNKNILIYILLLLCSFLAYKWYFTESNSDYKNELKELREQNDILSKKRDSVNNVLLLLESDLSILVRDSKLLNNKIDSMSLEIDLAKLNSIGTKLELNRLRRELSKTKSSIDNLINNPTNRTGEELLKSLKNNSKP